MKGKFVNLPEAAVVSAAIGVSGIGCLVTAFEFPHVSMVTVGLWCAAVALLGAICFRWRAGAWLLAAVAAAGVLLWFYGPLERGVEALVFRISNFYDMGYGTGVLFWNEQPPVEESLLPGLCALAACAVLASVWTLRRGSGLLPALVLGILPLGLCLGLVNHVPDSKWLFVLLAALLLLLLTRDARKTDPAAGSRQSLMLFVPVLAALGLLFHLVPRDTYDKQTVADEVFTQLTEWLEEVMAVEKEDSPVVLPQIRDERVDLNQLGPRIDGPYYVLEVNADFSGPVYLRQQIYDTYEGNIWSSSGERSGLPWAAPAVVEYAGDLRIRTPYAHPLLYTTYYPGAEQRQLMELPLVNTEGLREYTIPVQRLKENWHEYAQGTAITGDVRCLELPEDVRSWAEALLQEQVYPNGSSGTDSEILYGDMLSSSLISPIYSFSLERQAADICNYVRASARYDLNTQRMTGSGDFARWFLEESETGYCVHFATAATVLLRAAGIPARYVTGYMVEAKAGEPVTVRQRHAHAWVEYYVVGIGWQVMEPTPADSEALAPEATEPTIPRETLPHEVRPTQPQDATEPEETGVSNQGGSDGPQKVTAPWVAAALKWGLSVLAVLACILGQWRLRLRLRRKRLRSENPNVRAIACWQELTRQTKLLHTLPPRELFELAQKAGFSQHTLTVEELAAFDKAMADNVYKLKAQRWYRKLVYRLVFAAY